MPRIGDTVCIKGFLHNYFYGKKGIVEHVQVDKHQNLIGDNPFMVLIENSLLVFSLEELELYYS